MSVKRSYSENDKAAALALLKANGGNITRTARELKVPATTLRQWRDGEHVNATVTEKRDEKTRSLAEMYEAVTRAYLEHALSENVIQATSGKDAVITAATATDKTQLLQGKATSRTETTGKNGGPVEHRMTLISELSDEELDAIIDGHRS